MLETKLQNLVQGSLLIFVRDKLREDWGVGFGFSVTLPHPGQFLIDAVHLANPPPVLASASGLPEAQELYEHDFVGLLCGTVRSAVMHKGCFLVSWRLLRRCGLLTFWSGIIRLGRWVLNSSTAGVCVCSWMWRADRRWYVRH